MPSKKPKTPEILKEFLLSEVFLRNSSFKTPFDIFLEKHGVVDQNIWREIKVEIVSVIQEKLGSKGLSESSMKEKTPTVLDNFARRVRVNLVFAPQTKGEIKFKLTIHFLADQTTEVLDFRVKNSS